MPEMVRVYKVILMVIDHDQIDITGIADAIENTKYPNSCISPKVIDSAFVEIDWDEGRHPINLVGKQDETFCKLFYDLPGGTEPNSNKNHNLSPYQAIASKSEQNK